MKLPFLCLATLILGLLACGAATIYPINTGTNANDGRGDSFRAAMLKANTNFANLNDSISSLVTNGVQATNVTIVKTNGTVVSTNATAINIISGTNTTIRATNSSGTVNVQINTGGGSGGTVSDGDKGDVAISGSGTIYTVESHAGQFQGFDVYNNAVGITTEALVVNSGQTNYDVQYFYDTIDPTMYLFNGLLGHGLWGISDINLGAGTKAINVSAGTGNGRMMFYTAPYGDLGRSSDKGINNIYGTNGIFSTVTIDGLATNAVPYIGAGGILRTAALSGLTLSGGTLSVSGGGGGGSGGPDLHVQTNGTLVAITTNLNWSSGVTGYVSGATTVLGVNEGSRITAETGLTNTVNARQGGSTVLTNLSGTGAVTNLQSASITNTSMLPLVQGGTNTTGRIKTLTAGSNVTLTDTGTNISIAASGSGGSAATNLSNLTVTNGFAELEYRPVQVGTNLTIDLSYSHNVSVVLTNHVHIVFTNSADGIKDGRLKLIQDSVGGWTVIAATVNGGLIRTPNTNTLWSYMSTNAAAEDHWWFGTSQATNVWIYQESSYSPLPTGPKLQYGDYFEDFLGAQLPTGVPGYGPLGLYRDVSGTGTGGGGVVPGDSTSPGVQYIALGTSIAGQARIYNGHAAGNGTQYYLGGYWTNRWRFKFTTAGSTNNPAGTNNYNLHLGFSDTTFGVPTNGCVLYYSSNSPYLGFISSSTALFSTNYSSIVPTNGVWYTAEIAVLAVGGSPSAVCTLMGPTATNTVTLTTNIPSGKTVWIDFAAKKVDGTDSRQFDIDYCYLGFALPAARQ